MQTVPKKINLILTVPYKATIKVHVMIENKSFKISNSKFKAINCQFEIHVSCAITPRYSLCYYPNTPILFKFEH